MNSENLKKLDVSLASLESKIKENKDKLSKAGMDDKDKDEMMKMMDSMYGYIYDVASSLRSSIYAIDETLYKHSQAGHLPPLSPGGMKKLLEVCGENENYEVQKKIVWASRAKALEVSYKK